MAPGNIGKVNNCDRPLLTPGSANIERDTLAGCRRCKAMITFCEWNPARDEIAWTSGDGRIGCHEPAAVSLGRYGEWHLCDHCAKLSIFAHFRERSAMTALLYATRPPIAQPQEKPVEALARSKVILGASPFHAPARFVRAARRRRAQVTPYSAPPHEHTLCW